MKVFRICPAPGYLPEFRKLHRLRDKSFSEQIAIFRAENVLLPGGWAQAMESEGCEVFEALPQDWASQARWAAENDCSGLLLKPNQLFEILKAQIKAFQPDVLFLHGGAFYVISRRQRYELRSVLANPLVITGLWGDELPRGNTYESYLGDVDLIFCTSSAYKKHFDDARIPATMIGNCFDDTIKYEPASRKCYDLIFCGTTGYGYTDHIQRYEKLIRLMSETNLRIWAFAERLRGSPSFAFKFKILNIARRVPGAVLLVIRRLTGRVLANLVRLALLLRLTELPAEALLGPKPGADPLERYFDDKKPLRRLFHGRVRKPLVNTSDYYKLVSEAKIVLNLHRDEGADIGNIRCYEVTGLGSCLLTDRGDELREFFDVENDIVTFKTVEECVVKVRHLLAHPEEVERIAKNGQRTTLARHTVKHRARVITATLRARLTGAAQSSAKRSRSIVLASYDFDKHPISYDISFFLQAAEIYRKKAGAAGVAVAMIHPADMQNLAGVSKTADAIVDKHSRDFRVFHICVQIAELMPTLGVFNAKDRSLQNLFSGEDHGKIDVIPFPGPDVDHHSAYYRLVNENPELVTGFSASVEAHRYVTTWLNPILKGRKLLCVTLRQYRYDPERNSNLDAWTAFLSRVDRNEFAIVVTPDTDHIAEFKSSALGEYPCFEPACFDVDLRFALYEQAFLNMFVNNGPGAAATLDKKVRYLMFKLLVPSVPHCTEEFLRWNGFEIGETPKYATPFQRWVWDEDTEDVLWREFRAMNELINFETKNRRPAEITNGSVIGAGSIKDYAQ